MNAMKQFSSKDRVDIGDLEELMEAGEIVVIKWSDDSDRVIPIVDINKNSAKFYIIDGFMRYATMEEKEFLLKDYDSNSYGKKLEGLYCQCHYPVIMENISNRCTNCGLVRL